MKKKLLLITLMVALFVCLFVISTSAEKYVPAFGEMTKVEDMADKTTFGNDGKFDTCTSRVLMNDGVTYPAYYIYNESTTHAVNFSELNKATGKAYDRNTVICLEIPEGVTTLPNCFSATDSAIFWGDRYTPTLEYLKFSSTITSMSTDATIFSMKSLKCLDMSLSKVETIPTRGVQSASALTEIYFPATLKTILDNAFLGCSSLAYVDFTNTLLEDVGYRAFFDCYMLEEVKLGVHIKKMQTQCFYKAGTKSDKTYVKYYINNTFEEIYNEYGQIMQDAKTAVIYYTGTNTDTGFTVLHSNALKSGAASWATVDAKGDGFNDNETYTANTIIYNYNACKAFYDNVHKTSAPEYKFTSFVEGACTESTCSTCGNIYEGESFEPIVSFLGFAIKQDGTAVTVGYYLNTTSLQKYINEGNTFNYGVVGYIPAGTTCQPLEVSENGVVAIDKDYTIHAEIDGSYASIDFVIKGFPQEAVSLAMCMYIYDGESISYICGTKGADKDAGTASDVEQLASAYAITVNSTNGSIAKAE